MSIKCYTPFDRSGTYAKVLRMAGFEPAKPKWQKILSLKQDWLWDILNVPDKGLEPLTNGLKGHHSTDWVNQVYQNCFWFFLKFINWLSQFLVTNSGIWTHEV